jgi:phenylalanyl-tRNA synthetase beta chain
MKVSLNWLSEFVDLPNDSAALCDLLTLAGVEVERIEQRGISIPNVVVAQINESVQHPNADRLSICKVDDGSNVPRQIVCGAKNYRVGDKVPLALPGAVLPGDFKIKVGKLRGVESQGMLCSAAELSLAADAEGLLILQPSAPVGASLSELYPPEVVLDLEITPNRPDLLSHAGIAREVAALTGGKFRFASAAVRSLPSEASIENRAPALCPFYSARRITGVKIGPSPHWLRARLEAIGLRTINNVVDVTNFVMFEMGQPLHAFDAAKLRGRLEVRTGRDGESFAALDGRDYQLRSSHLAIADSERAIAIAGVMGSSETGVTDLTTDVWLESAYFQPASVRRTSRELGLMSDSSHRFERGVDPAGVLAASERATGLILEIAGGALGELATAGSLPDFTRVVPFSESRCAALLGTELPEGRAASILSMLGLQESRAGWHVPSFRQDLTREVDLIEEVTRVYGIENIPSRTMARFAPASAPDRAHDLRMRLRRALAARGFFEARSLTLISKKTLDRQFHPESEPLHIRNPLGEDQTTLRPALLPGLIRIAAGNARLGRGSLRLFELGRVFSSEKPEERTHIALVMSGAVSAVSWREGEVRQADFFDLKGILAALVPRAEMQFERMENQRLALAVRVSLGGTPIGFAGQLWPAEAREFDLGAAPLLVAEVDTDALGACAPGHFIEINKFPAVTRDVALVLPAEVPHAKVEETLRSADEPLLESFELFDVFNDPSGAKLPADRRSLAYTLTYRAPDRTLSADEASAAHARLKERLKGSLGAAFRE